MEHSFDVEVAKEVGANAAIIYKNIQFWCLKNKVNEVHFHDGYYWTYNSKKAFSELFPYMTERQVDYALNKLIEAKYIIKGNYNKSPYDKTLWYADICSFDNTKLCNQANKIVQPIPYSKQQIKNSNELLSKDNNSGEVESDFVFGVDAETSKPKKKKNDDEVSDAILLIQNYTDNKQLREELTTLVNTKKYIASKERRHFYCSTIKNYLDELSKTFGNDENKKIEAVKLSIRYNATTKVMVPNNIQSPNGRRFDDLIRKDDSYQKENHTKSEREF